MSEPICSLCKQEMLWFTNHNNDASICMRERTSRTKVLMDNIKIKKAEKEQREQEKNS